MQELEVVDKNDKIIGKYSREKIHKNGLLHREIHVWVFNINNDILFQKRADGKDTYPGLWDVAAGGHVEIGDDYETTAIKELEEETGLKVDKKDYYFINLYL